MELNVQDALGNLIVLSQNQSIRVVQNFDLQTVKSGKCVFYLPVVETIPEIHW